MINAVSGDVENGLLFCGADAYKADKLRSVDDVISELNLSGKRIAYTLAIPKGDTHVWENTEVEFFGRKFCTIGFPTEGIEENLPLSWNKKVKVELYG